MGGSLHGLLSTTTKIMQCFALRLRVVGWARYRRYDWNPGNNAFATDESRTSKVSGGLVNFLVY